MPISYTLGGFSFFYTPGSTPFPIETDLVITGSDDLELTFTLDSSLTDYLAPAGNLEPTAGSVIDVQLGALDLAAWGDDVTAMMSTVSSGGTSVDVLILYAETSGYTSVFQLNGDVFGGVPTSAELEALLSTGTFGPITSGPFAYGTPFSPADALGAMTAPAALPEPPIGTGITEFGDPAIAENLFADSTFQPDDLLYEGAIEAIALLPAGYEISEIGGPAVVSIDRGVFLTTGGGPGTENTSSSYSEALGEPGNALLDDAAQDAFFGAGSTNDAASISFSFDASELGSSPSISFDLFFGSDEYPEFVDSSFVDIAAVYVNGVNYALFNNDTAQPVSIVGESINTPGNFFDNSNNLYDTEYDGFSVLLTVVAPIQEGINEVFIGIADTGDSIYDSGMFIGNVQASDVNVSGSFVNVEGTEDDDEIETNDAPELIELGGGADTVTGSASQLDGDVIGGWGDDDTLFVQGSTFGADNVQVTMGSAILDIDTDQDGNADTTVILQGDFTNAEFSFTDVNGSTQINTTGAAPEGGVNLAGTDGEDTLVGTADDDTLTGGAGNDVLAGAGGNDMMSGGAGDDNLAGSDGDDTVNGDDGNDMLGGGIGNDVMNGGIGADTIGGGQGDDMIMGGDDGDVAAGGAGNDSITGEGGDDTMGGSYGADTLEGGEGNDSLGGGFGQDELSGGAGDDAIGGGEGDDMVYGNAGNDFLAGGGRNDEIFGGTGEDTINGGAGDDIMTGGADADLFIFNNLVDGEADVILDFEDGTDMLRLRGVDGQGMQGRFDALDISNTTYMGQSAAVVEYNGHTITLAGVSQSDLSVDDFMFI